jgi:hypothetical protein
MRTIRGILGAGLILVACAGVALAQTGSPTRAGSSPVVASARGESHFVLTYVFGLKVLDLRDFTFSARLRADGTVEGTYSYSDLEDGAPFTASGPITCLVIRGTRVWAGGPVTASNDPTQVGQDGWWQAADNRGIPGARDMTTLLGVGAQGQAKSYCDAAPDPKYPWPVQHGAIRVDDSQP